jgi:hypothetical protein
MQSLRFLYLCSFFQGMYKKVIIKDIARELGTVDSKVIHALANHQTRTYF